MKNSLQKAKEEARELVSEAIAKLFPPAVPLPSIEITFTKDPSHGDLSCPTSFRLASTLKKNPVEIAKSLAAEIASRKMANFSFTSSLNGFVNFSFSEKFLRSSLKEPLSKKRKFGMGATGKGKKAIVEYSSPNIGKPMHIGHIRSTILGDTVANVLKMNGYSVVRSNYLCEAGKQTAKLLLSLQLFGKEKIETEKDLLELYVKIHKEMETKPELDEKAQELVSQMELGDHAILKQLAKVRKLSTSPFHKNYALLGVNFNEEVYDSDYVEDGRKIANEALEKGIAFMDKNGETVANLEKLNLPNLIIIRSNGTTLYSTRDLGLADRDYRKYKFDRRIYVTASEQNLHFQQVFAILKALNKPYAPSLHHIGFGLISLEEGKLSTREGRVLLLEDVINDAISLALEEVKARQQYSEKDAAEIAKMVGIAALKYSVLRISSEKDIKFSLREAVKFDGNTAAYLQYTCVRAKNIMKKAKEDDGPVEAGNESPGSAPKTASKPQAYIFNPDERRLISLISQFPEVLEHSAKSLAPYILCDYLFRLALQFSAFYDSSPVLRAETAAAKSERLKLSEATLITMENGLSLLGIGVPEKM